MGVEILLTGKRSRPTTLDLLCFSKQLLIIKPVFDQQVNPQNDQETLPFDCINPASSSMPLSIAISPRNVVKPLMRMFKMYRATFRPSMIKPTPIVHLYKICSSQSSSPWYIAGDSTRPRGELIQNDSSVFLRPYVRSRSSQFRRTSGFDCTHQVS